MEAINQNMKSETIIAWRFMKDPMIVNGLTPQSIYTGSPSIKSVESPEVKYKRQEEQQKKEKQKNEATIQQEVISSDMLKLKDKCDQVQQAIDVMEKEYVDCIKRAEAGNNKSLVIKGNGIEKKK